MAKARKVNKSQMIRDYLAQHPDARPSEVAKALSEFGITPAFVSVLKATRKSESKAQPGRRKKRSKLAAPRTPAKLRKRPRREQHDHDSILLGKSIRNLCGRQFFRTHVAAAAELSLGQLPFLLFLDRIATTSSVGTFFHFSRAAA